MSFGQYSRNRVTTNLARETAPEKASKRTKTVFGSHDQTAHVWAQNNVNYGRSSDGRMHFSDGVIYSYGDHFPVACFLQSKPDGRPVVLFTLAGYSVSTGKHKSIVRRAIHGSNTILAYVPDLAKLKDWDSSSVRAVAEHMVRQAFAESDHDGGPDGAAIAAKAFYADFMPGAKFPRDLAAHVRALDKRDATRAKKDQASADKLLTDKARLENAKDATDKLRVLLGDEQQSRYSAIDSVHTSKRLRAQCLDVVKAAERLALKRFPYEEMREYARGFLRLQKAFGAKVKACEKREEQDKMHAYRAEQVAKVKAYGDKKAQLIVEDWQARMSAEYVLTVTSIVDETKAKAVWIMSVTNALREIEESFRLRNPHATDILYARRRAAHGYKALTRECWQAGEGAASSFDGAETLLRKKGADLETSLGATCPYRHAELAFSVAQHCVQTGKGWRRNGHTIHVGHFQVDSIDEDGMMRAGCHTLCFDEMQRLAIKESPHLVKPRYGLPVLSQAGV